MNKHKIQYSDMLVCPKCNTTNFIQDYYVTERDVHFQRCRNCHERFIWKNLKRNCGTTTQSMQVPSDTIYSDEKFQSLTQEEKAEFLADILSVILPMKHKTDRITSGVVVDRLLDLFDVVCLTKDKSIKVHQALFKLQCDSTQLKLKI